MTRVATLATQSKTMPVTILCPNLRCRAILQVPDVCRGKKVRCGQCGIKLTVPAGAGAGTGDVTEATVVTDGGKGGKGKGKK